MNEFEKKVLINKIKTIVFIIILSLIAIFVINYIALFINPKARTKNTMPGKYTPL